MMWINFVKIIKITFIKILLKTTWPPETPNCASSGRKIKNVYYFNLAGTHNLLLKAFIYCCRCWFFCCCCWCWCGCCLSTPANFIFVLLWWIFLWKDISTLKYRVNYVFRFRAFKQCIKDHAHAFFIFVKSRRRTRNDPKLY